MTYRIRSAIISDDHGKRRKLHIAERRRLGIWWPTSEAKWHDNPDDCRADIEHDKKMRKPLDDPKIVD